jgi:hypothetical protein
MYQVGVGEDAVPTLGTLRWSIYGYVDESTDPPTRYEACLKSAAEYELSLDEATLRGEGVVNVGQTVINNASGEFDFLEPLAIDGSEHRCYIGDPSWPRADFLHLYTAFAVKMSMPPKRQIAIELRAPSLLLNKSIGGMVAVGGSGPNANKYRPVNVGYVHQLEPTPITTTQFTYNDTGTNASVQEVRSNGVVLTGGGTDYTDNADGTFTLTVPPTADEKITCDVLVHAGSALDYRISDAFDELIGGRAGLTAAGKYLGAGDLYELDGVNDYHCGISIAEKRNCKDICDDLCNTSNGFWAFTRTGSFFYSWMRPEALAFFLGGGSGVSVSVATDIEKDDILGDSLAVKHRTPTYAGYQGMGNLNWFAQSTFSSSLDALEREQFTRDGYIAEEFFGEEPTSTAYRGFSASWQGGAPELYHLSLSDSQLVKTLIAGPDDTTDIVPGLSVDEYLGDHASVRRSQNLPWVQFANMTVWIDKYFLELGDIVRLSYDRHDFVGDGRIVQVYRIKLRPMQARIDLGVVRRRFADVDPGTPGTAESGYLLQEDGDRILQESGDGILIE